jgi:hypothetical protein
MTVASVKVATVTPAALAPAAAMTSTATVASATSAAARESRGNAEDDEHEQQGESDPKPTSETSHPTTYDGR